MPGPPITVCYDASVTLAPRSGIGRFALELLRALIAGNQGEFQFVVLLNSLRHSPGAEHRFLWEYGTQVRVSRWRMPGPWLVSRWARGRGPTLESLIGGRPDVVVAPSGYLPQTRAPLVATVHDVAFLREAPAEREPLGGGLFAEAWPRQLPRTRAIATDSEFVRADLLGAFPALDPERVVAIPPGINGSFLMPAEPQRRGWPYYFAVTDRRPRKRLDLLLRAYAIVRAAMGDRAPELLVRGLPMENAGAPGVVLVPPLTDHELAQYYAGALATVIPSREEGFGFPLLEAMAQGSPVICGRNSSLAEVGAGYASFVDDQDEVGFASAMLAHAHPVDHPRDREERRQHAATFSWDASARRYARLLSAVARPRPTQAGSAADQFSSAGRR